MKNNCYHLIVLILIIIQIIIPKLYAQQYNAQQIYSELEDNVFLTKPRLSPNLKYIAFVREYYHLKKGHHSIRKIDKSVLSIIDLEEDIKVEIDTLSIKDLTWCPDSKKIAICADNSIVTYDIENKQSTEIIRNKGEYFIKNTLYKDNWEYDNLKWRNANELSYTKSGFESYGILFTYDFALKEIREICKYMQDYSWSPNRKRLIGVINQSEWNTSEICANIFTLEPTFNKLTLHYDVLPFVRKKAFWQSSNRIGLYCYDRFPNLIFVKVDGTIISKSTIKEESLRNKVPLISNNGTKFIVYIRPSIWIYDLSSIEGQELVIYNNSELFVPSYLFDSKDPSVRVSFSSDDKKLVICSDTEVIMLDLEY
jgi:hypothetical protein